MSHVNTPVTLAILVSISRNIHQVVSNHYEELLFKAVFSLAFFAFLQTDKYTQSHHNLIQLNVHVMDSAVRIRFTSYKFSHSHIAEILLPRSSFPLCPVVALSNYIEVCPGQSFYCFVDELGDPVRTLQVRLGLCKVSALLNLPHACITTHSFRITAATTATAGAPDDCIMRMGH